MRILIFYWLGLSALFGQVKYEVQDISGIVVAIQPGLGFAYEVLELKVNEESNYFNINPEYGKSILSKIKIGQPLEIKVNVNLTLKENLKRNGNKLPKRWPFYWADKITEVKMNGQWISTPYSEQFPSVFKRNNWHVFLEETVKEKRQNALIFENDKIGFGPGLFFFERKTIDQINAGDQVSFIGSESKVSDKYWYPIEGVKSVYSFTPLNKTVGKIKSFIYKQNFVRIGLTINQYRLSFPADLGKSIEKFVNEEPVTIYYLGEGDERANLLPTVHAIVQGADSVLIPYHYYGDPDGKHEHKEAELDGKISRVNRSDKGRIISLIMGNDCYVEVSPKMAEQLGNYLSKGKVIKILGDERIKKAGEIYEQNFRIITPRKVVADGKEFILKN